MFINIFIIMSSDEPIFSLQMASKTRKVFEEYSINEPVWTKLGGGWWWPCEVEAVEEKCVLVRFYTENVM
jgi:hypothetical protein